MWSLIEERLFAAFRDHPEVGARLDETIMKAQEAGRKYISVASQILAAN